MIVEMTIRNTQSKLWLSKSQFSVEPGDDNEKATIWVITGQGRTEVIDLEETNSELNKLLVAAGHYNRHLLCRQAEIRDEMLPSPSNGSDKKHWVTELLDKFNSEIKSF